MILPPEKCVHQDLNYPTVQTRLFALSGARDIEDPDGVLCDEILDFKGRLVTFAGKDVETGFLVFPSELDGP